MTGNKAVFKLVPTTLAAFSAQLVFYASTSRAIIAAPLDEPMLLLIEPEVSAAKPLMRESMRLGHEVVWSQHHEDAQRLLQLNIFDLIVLGEHFPYLMKLEIVCQLDKHRPRLPILVLLNRNRSSKAYDHLLNGAQVWLAASFRPDAFRLRLQSILPSLPNAALDQ